MRAPTKVVIGVLAGIGGIALLYAAYVTFVLPDCRVTRLQTIAEPTGHFVAHVLGRRCSDPALSGTSITVASVANGDRMLALKVGGEPDAVEVNWQAERALVVRAPKEMSVSRFGLPGGWPIVRVEQP